MVRQASPGLSMPETHGQTHTHGRTDRQTDRHTDVRVWRSPMHKADTAGAVQRHTVHNIHVAGGGRMAGVECRRRLAVSLLISAAAGIRGGGPRWSPSGLKHGLRQYQLEEGVEGGGGVPPRAG